MPDENNPGTQKFRRTRAAHATVKAYKNDKGREPRPSRGQLRRGNSLLMLAVGIGGFNLSTAPEQQQKKKNYVRIFLILAVYLGIFAFLTRKQADMPLTIGSIVVMFAAIYAVLASRKIVAFVVAHPKLTRISGFAIIILGVLLIPAVIIAFPKAPSDNMWLMACFIAPIMLGSLLIALPGSAAYQAKIFSGEVQPAKKASIGFDGFREAAASIGFAFSRWRAFLSVAGIWTILHAFVPLAAAQIVAQNTGVISHIYDPIMAKANAAVGVATLFASIIVDLFAVPIVAVAWHRYVFEGDIPRWGMALPSRGTLRYLYIVWVFSGVLGTFDKMIAGNTHDLAALIGSQNASLAIKAAEDLVGVFALWMFSSFALILPAAIFKGRRMDIQNAVRAAFSLGHTYRLGLVAAILPGTIASFELIKLLDYAFPNSVSAQQACMIGPGLFYFLAVTSGATYLSRAYQAASHAADEGAQPISSSVTVD